MYLEVKCPHGVSLIIPLSYYIPITTIVYSPGFPEPDTRVFQLFPTTENPVFFIQQTQIFYFGIIYSCFQTLVIHLALKCRVVYEMT